MSRPKRDPLIAAMIAKLPDGDEWPVDRQLAWLHLMAMAFGTVYGGDAASRLGQVPTQIIIPRPEPDPRRKVIEPMFPFYIDEKGNARRAGGAQIKASEVKGDLVDLRGMDGDVKSIRWADGTTGLNGADLTIIAV